VLPEIMDIELNLLKAVDNTEAAQLVLLETLTNLPNLPLVELYKLMKYLI
jgi:hypothetical protein